MLMIIPKKRSLQLSQEHDNPKPMKVPCKRVTFAAAEDNSSMRRPRQEVHLVEPLWRLPQEQKKQLWLQEEEIQCFLKKIQCVKNILHPRKLQDRKTNLYGDVLLSIFNACCEDDNDLKNNQGIPNVMATRQQMELLSSRGGRDGYAKEFYPRGLECCTAQELTAKRRQLQKENIQNIVAVHLQLCSECTDQDTITGTLCSTAEQLSLPSRKFAQVIGLGDSLSAFHEYVMIANINADISKKGPSSFSSANARAREKSVAPPVA